jgi:hypothetical protein
MVRYFVMPPARAAASPTRWTAGGPQGQGRCRGGSFPRIVRIGRAAPETSATAQLSFEPVAQTPQ